MFGIGKPALHLNMRSNVSVTSRRSPFELCGECKHPIVGFVELRLALPVQERFRKRRIERHAFTGEWSFDVAHEGDEDAAAHKDLSSRWSYWDRHDGGARRLRRAIVSQRSFEIRTVDAR
jgi:hypothetical protein